MTRTHTSRRRTTCLAAAIVLSTIAAACGSDDGASDQLPEPATPATTPSTSPSSDPAVDEPAAAPSSDGTVIGTANMNGTVVDPKPHPIDDMAIAESYPEQLQITFSGADASCTAADARAVADGDTVRIELEVGITEDALAKSCLAGEFTHNMSIALTEGLDGRTVTLGN